MTECVRQQLQWVKKASKELIEHSQIIRNQILFSIAHRLRESVDEILTDNQKDLHLMDSSDPKYDRLVLTRDRIHAMALDVESIANMPHSDHCVREEKILGNGMKIQRISVPFGVVAMIYESRPNVTVDAFTLCLKSGNACILKGGKEAWHTNGKLVSLMQEALIQHHMNPQSVYLFPLGSEALDILLQARDSVDVCIPRGSQGLIQFVRNHAKIPFIETGAGIVHTYFDEYGDLEKARLIIENAKTRRVSVCNALDTLIVHERRVHELPRLVGVLEEKHVELHADEQSYHVLHDTYSYSLLKKAHPSDFGIEFLDYKMSIKTVQSVQDAVAHISTWTSGHSEAIISEDQNAISYFLNHVDSAVLYVNASTAFTDGAQFGMGSEIGISTQKLHARGPMALDALLTYKWLVFGDGHVRP